MRVAAAPALGMRNIRIRAQACGRSGELLGENDVMRYAAADKFRLPANGAVLIWVEGGFGVMRLSRNWEDWD